MKEAMLYEKLESERRLLHKTWSYFNGMFAVFHPRTMSAIRLQRETLKAYRRFYSLRRVSVEAFALIFNVIIDAMVWNFKRAYDYSFNLMFMRGGANFLVKRFSPLSCTDQILPRLFSLEHKDTPNAQLKNISLFS